MAENFKTVIDAMAATGTDTPRQALQALNAKCPPPVKGFKRQRYAYKPHVGAKQLRKAAERAALAAGLPDVFADVVRFPNGEDLED